MKQITQLGATVEEAISLALQQLKTTRDQVEVEVLQEGKKGFLGFGARQAEVRVTVNEMITEPIVEAPHHEENIQEETVETVEFEVENEKEENPLDIAQDYLQQIAIEMGIDDLSIDGKIQGKNVLFKLESEKAALLIGKRGATLNALQQLTQLVVNKSSKSFLMVKLDVENYRERRQIALEQLAERMADKAIRSGKKVSLEPMPSYERKVIHNALANRVDIETYSEGTEPNRHLVIEPVK
ncbi:protein jag [Ureibacillus sp. Re31]|uniref:RNA-binding protein KhpB n=1 Tax=Ureibacillus galli TaxID=2762222 RepID=A0ABR8XBS9_9BACL|nr:RNA-binding cell elongation regulator Jag/EloR [Ureibacillus galli]MBD8026696.1 protein jag [Ureibacillus galli]